MGVGMGDLGKEPVVTNNSLSYSFDGSSNVAPSSSRFAKETLRALHMEITPEVLNSERGEYSSGAIHISFEHEVLGTSKLVTELCNKISPDGMFRITGENNKKLALRSYGNSRITKDMVKNVLTVLHKYDAISRDDAIKAAENFGIESIVLKEKPTSNARKIIDSRSEQPSTQRVR